MGLSLYFVEYGVEFLLVGIFLLLNKICNECVGWNSLDAKTVLLFKNKYK